jgi:hypothetical protein
MIFTICACYQLVRLEFALHRDSSMVMVDKMDQVMAKLQTSDLGVTVRPKRGFGCTVQRPHFEHRRPTSGLYQMVCGRLYGYEPHGRTAFFSNRRA